MLTNKSWELSNWSLLFRGYFYLYTYNSFLFVVVSFFAFILFFFSFWSVYFSFPCNEKKKWKRKKNMKRKRTETIDLPRNYRQYKRQTFRLKKEMSGIVQLRNNKFLIDEMKIPFIKPYVQSKFYGELEYNDITRTYTISQQNRNNGIDNVSYAVCLLNQPHCLLRYIVKGFVSFANKYPIENTRFGLIVIEQNTYKFFLN